MKRSARIPRLLQKKMPVSGDRNGQKHNTTRQFPARQLPARENENQTAPPARGEADRSCPVVAGGLRVDAFGTESCGRLCMAGAR